MKIKEIIKATNGKLIKGNEEYECEEFCKDTRIIKKGNIYIGIKGEHFNGNELWKEALEKGASTIIIEGIKIPEDELTNYEDKNIIYVENTIKAICDIAKYKRNICKKDFQLIGITGSVGKTSTKDIVSNVISQKYKTLKTQGNNNNNIGLPFTLFNLKDHQVAVIEMGMNHSGEIRELTEIAKPTISVITNVGTSHIGNLGSRANILNAKLEIIEGMEKKILVINNDNDLLHDFYLKNKDKNIEIYTYGIENNSNTMAEDIILKENHSEFVCKINKEKFKVKVPIGGMHFVYNALCAATVGNILGLDFEQIKTGIETFELTKKRMDIKELENGVKVINDSYNANFESMQASLKYLSGFDNRKIAVLGDMFELGKFSEEFHKKVGKEVKENNIDILICLGEKAKYIAESAEENGMKKENIYYFQNREKIVDFIKSIWKENDVYLFKASNGMKFFELADKLLT